MQEMSVRTALKQDKFTGSEGDLTNKVELTSEEDLTQKNARSSMQMRDRVLLRLIGET